MDKQKLHGQSFVELALVLMIVLILMLGVVEFGFLINNYLHVMSASREAARVYNSYHAFDPDTLATDEGFFFKTAEQAALTMDPIRLNPSLGDDIVITVVTLDAGTDSIIRYPYGLGPSEGWSFCANYSAYTAYVDLPLDQLSGGWDTCTPQPTNLTNSQIRNLLGGSLSSSGLLIVEIYYNYPLLLKIPLFSDSSFMGVRFSLIPDPVPVYTYSVMPMSSADPTSP